MHPFLDASPDLRPQRRLRAAPHELRLGAEPGQLARALGALPGVRQDLRAGLLAQRGSLQLLEGRMPGHDAPPSTYPASRSRNCSRARWISFFTFCSFQPIASAICS